MGVIVAEETGNFSVEMENGIFNLIISLCQHKANFMTIEKSKEEVAQYLEKLVDGLRFNEENEMLSKDKVNINVKPK